MNAGELIAKLQQCDPSAEVGVDFVKELYGIPVEPRNHDLDVVGVTRYDGSTQFVTLQLGTPRMRGGSDPWTPSVVGVEVLL